MTKGKFSILVLLMVALASAGLTLTGVVLVPNFTNAFNGLNPSQENQLTYRSSTATYRTGDQKKMSLTIEFSTLAEGGNVVFFDLNNDGIIEPGDGWGCAAPDDEYGHETHVAGILQSE